MWKSPRGTRKVKGRERDSFVESVLSLYDYVREAQDGGDESEVGVPVFDHLPPEDRGVVLLHVAEHVLGAGAAPDVRAWNAGTIGAVFVHLETMIALEIETEDFRDEGLGEGPGAEDFGFAGKEDPASRVCWRKLVHEAWMERCFPECDVTFRKGQGNRQPIESKDRDAWVFKVQGLEGELLEDDDYAMEGMMDAPAGKVAGAKEYLGIELDYFTEAPPVFPTKERKRLEAFHAALIWKVSRR